MKEKELEVIEKNYDRNAAQTICWAIETEAETYKVSHTLKPLSDERFFEFALESEKNLKRATKADLSLLTPKINLWRELVESVEGYEEAADWKEQMFENDAVSAVTHFLNVDVVPNEAKTKKLRSFNQNTTIKLAALHGTTVFTGLEITFRRASQAERSLWIQLLAGTDEQLASAVEISAQEKQYRLARKLFVDCKGYENKDIPAWHLTRAAWKYFDNLDDELGKLTKFSAN